MRARRRVSRLPLTAAMIVAAALGALAQDSDIPALVVPNAPDLMITTRQSVDRPDSPVSTTTVFLKGARQRIEQLAVIPLGGAITREARTLTIVQCDTKRTIQISPASRLYAAVPFPDLEGQVETRRLLQAAARRKQQPQPPGPEVAVSIDGVDTGERRNVGGYVARHIVTTTKMIPSAQASTHATERVEDGWYIDLPSADCRDWGERRTALLGVTGASTPGKPPDQLRIERHGAAAVGFAVERVVHESDDTARQSFTQRTTLLEVSQKPLDAALFDVPQGYQPALRRAAGGFDLSKPDTLRNRLTDYWDNAVAWAQSFFRPSRPASAK